MKKISLKKQLSLKKQPSLKKQLSFKKELSLRKQLSLKKQLYLKVNDMIRVNLKALLHTTHNYLIRVKDRCGWRSPGDHRPGLGTKIGEGLKLVTESQVGEWGVNRNFCVYFSTVSGSVESYVCFDQWSMTTWKHRSMGAHVSKPVAMQELIQNVP